MPTQHTPTLIIITALSLTSCSHSPTLANTKNAMLNIKNSIVKTTPRLLKKRKPRYPAALPLRKVYTRPANTCPPPTRVTLARGTIPAYARRQPVRPTPQRRVIKPSPTHYQRPATRQAQNTYPRPVIQQPRITHARYTPPAPQAPRLNPQQASQQLFNVAKTGNAAQIHNLIRQGANVNAANGNGETALHAAASTGNLAAAQTLIRQGANVNAQTIRGWTPLHTAARFGHANIAALLLGSGAQRHAINADGRTPAQLARQAHQQGIAVMLQ